MKIHPVAKAFPSLAAPDFDNLVQDIESNGLIHPIVLTPAGDTIVDGRNRYRACLKAQREPTFTRLADHYSEEEIIQYIVSANLNRRHLSVSQRAMIAAQHILPALERIAHERKRAAGGDHSSAKAKAEAAHREKSPTPKAKRPREIAAETLNISDNVVQRAKAVARVAPVLAERVSRDEISLNRAYHEAKQQAIAIGIAAPKDGRFAPNRTGELTDVAAWTWDPITGCMADCPYCYARAIVSQPEMQALFPGGFTPILKREKLAAPASTALKAESPPDGARTRALVGFMGDLYGRGVPDDWITEVHAACRQNPQWEYVMLTKFPARYAERKDLPPTMWAGVTVDRQDRVTAAEEAFDNIREVAIRWLCLEPLLEPLKFRDLSMFDWVVLGAQRRTVQPNGIGVVKEFAPPFEWVTRLVDQAHEAGCAVYMKASLLGAPRPELPGMELLRELPPVRQFTS